MSDPFADKPFLRLLPFVVLGVLLAELTSLSTMQIGISLVLILLLIAFAIRASAHYKHQSIASILLLLAVLLASFIRSSVRHDEETESLIDRVYDDKALLLLRLREGPKEGERSYRYIADVIGMKVEDSVLAVAEGILLYLPKQDSFSALKHSDLLRIESYPQAIPSPRSPYAFDRRRFWLGKGISHQVYCKQAKVINAKTKTGASLANQLLRIRSNILDRIDRILIDPRSAALFKAMLLGEKKDLDQDMRKTFSQAGIIHLLAVSGLHLGIIFGLLGSILKISRMQSKFPFCSAILSLIFLWLFAALAAFSPSVCRAACMFSFIAIGQAMRNKQSILNSMAASATLLIWIRPDILFELGFQLSYLAVAGIVILQPWIASWIYFKWSFARKIWELSAVSIAAQITTTPLCIYVFKGFPTYFLFTNLLAVPLASLILPIGLLSLLLDWIRPIHPLMSLPLNGLLLCLNEIGQFSQTLPYAYLNGLAIDNCLILALYMGLLLFLIGIKTRNSRLLNPTLAVLLMGSIGSLFLRTQGLVGKEVHLDTLEGRQLIWSQAEDRIHCQILKEVGKMELDEWMLGDEMLKHKVPAISEAQLNEIPLNGKQVLIGLNATYLSQSNADCLPDRNGLSYIIWPEIPEMERTQLSNALNRRKIRHFCPARNSMTSKNIR